MKWMRLGTLTLVMCPALCSCATTHQTPIVTVAEQEARASGGGYDINQSSSAPRPPFTAPEGAAISEYTTADGVRHRFDGSARLDSESVYFHRPEKRGRGLEAPAAEVAFALPVRDVKSLGVQRADPLAYLAVAAMIAVLAGLIYYRGWLPI